MAKTDLILKKAELFERFAVYGNRKNFLKAIAQSSEYYEEFASMEKAFRQNAMMAKNIINKVYPDLTAADFETPEQALNMIEKTVAMHGDKFPNEDMSALSAARNNISNFIAQKGRYQQGFSQQFGDQDGFGFRDKSEQAPVAKKPSQSVNALVNFYAAQVQIGIRDKKENLLRYYLPKLYDTSIRAVKSNDIDSYQQQQYLNLYDQGKSLLKILEANSAASELSKMDLNKLP